MVATPTLRGAEGHGHQHPPSAPEATEGKERMLRGSCRGFPPRNARRSVWRFPFCHLGRSITAPGMGLSVASFQSAVLATKCPHPSR